MARKTIKFHLRLDEVTWQQLQDLANWLQTSMSDVVRRAIHDFWLRHRR
jgi:predicted transcriptional regulator